MAYSADAFNHHISMLTDPEHGVVHATTMPSVFQIGNVENPRRYIAQRPLVVVTGPSRAGKDTVLAALMATGAYSHVKTATTRRPRVGEAIDAYTWMRPAHNAEAPDDYLAALTGEYRLIETDVHHGDVYGLPAGNLESISTDKTPLLNTDTRGIRSLKKNLVGTFSIVSFLICPPSAEELASRMAALGHQADGRLTVGQSYLEDAASCVDYVVLNRTQQNVTKAASAIADQVHNIILSDIA